MMPSVVIRQGAIPPDVTIVVLSEEATDGSRLFRAEIPELPGCMSHGDTQEEALQNLEEAFALYAEVLAEQGRQVASEGITLTSGTTFESPSIAESSFADDGITVEEFISP